MAHIRTTLLWSNWTLRSPSLPLYSPSTCLTRATPSIPTSAGLQDGAKLEVRGDVKRNKCLFRLCLAKKNPCACRSIKKIKFEHILSYFNNVLNLILFIKKITYVGRSERDCLHVCEALHTIFPIY